MISTVIVDDEAPICDEIEYLLGKYDDVAIVGKFNNAFDAIAFIAEKKPRVVFLGIWFLMQLVSGLAGTASAGQAAAVAFWAHVGGFAAGLALVRVFLPPGCQFCFDPSVRRYDRE